METIQPWYKQFWPWVLIFLPGCAVVASVTTLFIAIDNKPDMVVEDYYKKGKAIDVDLTRLENAYKLALKFRLTVTDDSLTVKQTFGEPQTAALKVRFIHRTQEAKDFEQMITANGSGDYTLALEKPLQGKWTVQLESFDGHWRIQTVDTYPSSIDTLLDSFDR
ncbi:FixH family protein [Psychrobium sp. 1_MG-2023]|uniref:FixH family protein n=1 Tax=Psychrobium sp. 1_MG-2023 TaxID=3062624 RepID=UPI000C31FFCE|nr:FixH family protein [Psychrobium sp. 1_MG-2023]MDP2561547.1 FixH family protein [Psychrobium sp. 1_MG-2023]PKF55010.1 cytochrome C oxidase Cbb3 [Alteromonadales bacterium alter-6D02]